MKLNLSIPDFERYTSDQQFVNVVGALDRMETQKGGLTVEEIWEMAWQVVDMLKKAKFDGVWLVGDEFKQTDCPFHIFNNIEEVKAAIQHQQPQGHYILIKGSNSNRLFELPALL